MFRDETELSRVTRSKDQAKATYDKLSKWYDLLAGRFETKCRDLGIQKLNAQQGEIILEIGFGTGHCLVALAQSVGDSGKVYGIDMSQGMCQITRTRVKRAGLSDRVELRCGDAAQLPFAANFFDAVFISFALELFDTPEIPVILHECRRVLRGRGRICIIAMSKKGKAGWMMKLYEWLHRKFPNYFDCRPIFVEKALADAHFQVLDVAEMPIWGLPVEIVVVEKV